MVTSSDGAELPAADATQVAPPPSETAMAAPIAAQRCRTSRPACVVSECVIAMPRWNLAAASGCIGGTHTPSPAYRPRVQPPPTAQAIGDVRWARSWQWAWRGSRGTSSSITRVPDSSAMP